VPVYSMSATDSVPSVTQCRAAYTCLVLLCLGTVCAASLSYIPTRDPFAMEVKMILSSIRLHSK
jgi:hypothetical protein